MATCCVTKSGGRCPKPELGPGLPCGLHQADPEARRAFLSAQGARGRRKRLKNEAAARRRVCSLRCTDDFLGELERLLVKVEASGAEMVNKAQTVVKIISEARSVLKAAELETENAELKKLLLQHHPELKSHLRIV
jgi:hypothetical protein